MTTDTHKLPSILSLTVKANDLVALFGITQPVLLEVEQSLVADLAKVDAFICSDCFKSTVAQLSPTFMTLVLVDLIHKISCR